MSQKILCLLLVITFVLVPGCEKAPSDVITSTDSAFAALTASNANLYAPEALETANQALAMARTELETQNAKSALTRKYTETTRLFTEARNLAQAAVTATDSGRQAAQTAANEAVELARLRLTEAATLLDDIKGCPVRAKGLAADTAMLQGRIDVFSESLPALETKIGTADFIGARSDAEGLVLQVEEMNVDLGSALDRLGCQKSDPKSST